MAWKVRDCMSERQEFVALASAAGANMSELCLRFGIARKTGYKWLHRFHAKGQAGLADQSRRPHRLRCPTPDVIVQFILDLRRRHPCWGPRKLGAVLARTHQSLADQLPCASTIASILRREGCIDPAESLKHQPMRRFERSAPNELWQMDFKGPFATADGRACHPLTILDDHSRYNLCLQACNRQTHTCVQTQLTRVFERYGLPQEMLMDNGNPWGSSNAGVRHTRLTLWLMRLDIATTHGRPYHPQTQGKEERFHRTLKAELLQDRQWSDATAVQRDFDDWRSVYNHVRPHDALGLATPATRYQASVRSLPSVLEPVVYDVGDEVRKVSAVGQIMFRHRRIKLSQVFAGQGVALRPTQVDGLWQVYFSRFAIAQVDLRVRAGDKGEGVG